MAEDGLHGILLVDKPAGMTSAGVVREVKKRLRVAKVGHLGTLDPFATGLLPICLGEGAKIVPYLNEEEKVYSGTIRLGVATDTLDPTGRPTATAAVPSIGEEALAAVACRFVGEIEQVPPMYSALKRQGVPLYELARRGIEVERPARRVRIDSLRLEPAGEGLIRFSVHCSKGTYVRTLAADLAASLGTVGHLETLRREAFGSFTISAAVKLEGILPGAELPLVSLRQALASLRELPADSFLVGRIRLGQQWSLASLPSPRSADEIAKIVASSGNLVALIGADGESWKILRVFAPLSVSPLS